MSNIAFSVLAFVVGLFAGVCAGVCICAWNERKQKELYDFHYCAGARELAQTLDYINGHGHQVINVTQREGIYTVVFRRFADG